jgi:hypothetical protein
VGARGGTSATKVPAILAMRYTYPIPMGKVWQTIRSYIWWAYDRGSVPYDIMVTLILAFIFLTPLWVNFKDKPTERIPHQTGVVVYQLTDREFTYQVEASAVRARDGDAIRRELLGIIEPIAGEVDITSYTPMRDKKGNVIGYQVQVTK